MAYRSFGRFHCPMCFATREFISEDPRVSDANDAECCECQYQFGYVTDPATGQRRGVLTAAQQQAARESRLAEYRRELAGQGIRLEDVGRKSTHAG